MKKFLGILAFGLLTLWPARAATVPLYVNDGVINMYPADQIDALAFANYGTFSVSTIFPFDFENTLNFTNKGIMNGNPGFQFDTARSSAPRAKAHSFFNDVNGLVTVSGFLDNASYISIWADNIVNRGRLSVGDGGLLKLQGDWIDVNRSQLEVRPAAGGGFGDFVTPSNFIPASGIADVYWGGLTNGSLSLPGFVNVRSNGVTVITPIYFADPGYNDRLALANPLVGVYTNQPTATNGIVQVGFVGYDTNMLSARIRFTPYQSQTGFQQVSAEVSMALTNSVTGQVQQDTIYIVDSLAAQTNYVMLTNLNTGTTYRPANYRVTRAMPNEFALGDIGNARLTTNLIYGPAFSNAVVQTFWSAYAAYVAGGLADPAQLPGTGITNLPGRIEIQAKTLDMRRARLRGNSTISIRGDHVYDTAGATIDAPNLLFNLSSTNGNLHIRDITKDVMYRFDGFVRMWSATWSNQAGVLTTNITVDPGTGLVTTNLATNALDIGFHAMVVDADLLGTTQEVVVHNFAVHSTHVEIEDNLRVVGPLLFDAESLLLRSQILYDGGENYVFGGEGYFGSTNAPRMRSFTNEAVFDVLRSANFGLDRPVPYEHFVNRGTIQAAGLRVGSDYFQNSGGMVSDGGIEVRAKLGKLQTGLMRAGTDILIGANDLKLHQATNISGSGFALDVANSLTDIGAGADNLFVTGAGFRMARKPRFGDLLGTQVQSTAPQFRTVEHLWPAEDRGVSTNGFRDNVALGRLVLSSGAESVLQFHGPDPYGQYAIYVDYLDLQGFVLSAYRSNLLDSVLSLDPNVKIYFAYAGPAPDVQVEELDGALGGQIRWVKDFVGPLSYVDVLMESGVTIRVNRGLRESLTIDSDGDGLANGYDRYPFSEPVIGFTVTTTSTPARAVVQWLAAPLSTYVVEMSSSLLSSEWTAIGTVSNPDNLPREVSLEDALPEGETTRYYRVRYTP